MRLAVVLRPEYQVALLDLGHLEPVVVAPDGGGAHGGAHGAGGYGTSTWLAVWGAQRPEPAPKVVAGSGGRPISRRASSGVMIPAST